MKPINNVLEKEVEIEKNHKKVRLCVYCRSYTPAYVIAPGGIQYLFYCIIEDMSRRQYPDQPCLADDWMRCPLNSRSKKVV